MSIDTAAIAALHRHPAVTHRILTTLIAQQCFQRPLATWTTSDLESSGIPPDAAIRIISAIPTLDISRVAQQLRLVGVTLVPFDSPSYPNILQEISSPPPLLYVRGEVAALHGSAIGVVGTRQPTPYGERMTSILVEPVAKRGLTIVSGLAKGIDGLAHRTALDCGAATVAVLGSGVDVIYPWDHRQLAAEIISRGGAIISEFPLGAKPERHHFPQRNRIISGLSKGVLLVEAGEKSGALITAKFAVEQNRDVFALPGPVTSPQSVGPHNWIKVGAKLVTSGFDILEALSMTPVYSHQSAPSILAVGDTEHERQILATLGFESVHIDEIVEKSRLDTSVVSATITLMEIKGTVRHLGGQVYTRS